jgi:hypothetical protein
MFTYKEVVPYRQTRNYLTVRYRQIRNYMMVPIKKGPRGEGHGREGEGAGAGEGLLALGLGATIEKEHVVPRGG